MVQKEKVTQLKQEIKLLQEKLGETIRDGQITINSGKALMISKELDDLIVEYYDMEAKPKYL